MTPVSANRQSMINTLRTFPDILEAAIVSIPRDLLIRQTLPDEWTVAQVVHHLADAHMNAYIRFKLVLVEDYPTFKPYEQVDWAETTEAMSDNINDSILVLKGLHNRWTHLMESLSDEQWQRKGLHPDLGEISLQGLLEGYVRHSHNHLEQIQKILRAAKDE